MPAWMGSECSDIPPASRSPSPPPLSDAHFACLRWVVNVGAWRVTPDPQSSAEWRFLLALLPEARRPKGGRPEATWPEAAARLRAPLGA